MLDTGTGRLSATKGGSPFEQSHDASADVVLDAEPISGDEVGSIVECTKRHHSDLLVLGMRKHSWLMAGHTAKDLTERAPCALLGIR